MIDNVTIESDDKITRYLFGKNQFASSNGRVKYSAFLPPNGKNETSVFKITDLKEEDIWKIGDINVAPNRGKPIQARGDLFVVNVQNAGLEVEMETTPHELHANIIGWPDHKAARILSAKKLEKKAKLLLKVDGV